MKLNRIFFISILLVLMLAIGAASASEEISDDISSIEPTDEAVTESVAEELSEDALSQAVEDEVSDEELSQAVEDEVSDEELSQAVDVSLDKNVLGTTEDDIKDGFVVNISDSLYEWNLISVETRSTRAGNLSILVDGEKKAEKTVSDKFGTLLYFDSYELGFSGGDSRLYTIKVNFFDDAEQINVTLAEKSLFYMNIEGDEPNWFMSTDEILPFSVRFPDVTSGSITVYVYGTGDAYNELGSADIIDKTAKLDISGLKEGDNRILIKYSTDLHNGNRTSYIYVRNNTENVAVSVPTVIEQGDKATVTVKSNESAKVFIFVDGKMTEYSDVSSVDYTLPALSVGTHTVRVVFDKNFGRSDPFYSNTFKVVVKAKSTPAVVPAKKTTKVATKIVAKKKTFKVKVKVKKYTVTLKTKAGKAIKKVKLSLKVKGKTYKATTNSKGKATFKIKNLKKKGKYYAVIKFAGNKNYKASSKKVKITVKK